MDTATPVIFQFSLPEFKKVVLEASDGKRYRSDLSLFEKVYCFPKSFEEWKRAYLDQSGAAIVWSSRFEVHIDQVIGLAYRVESSKTSA